MKCAKWLNYSIMKSHIRAAQIKQRGRQFDMPVLKLHLAPSNKDWQRLTTMVGDRRTHIDRDLYYYIGNIFVRLSLLSKANICRNLFRSVLKRSFLFVVKCAFSISDIFFLFHLRHDQIRKNINVSLFCKT